MCEVSYLCLARWDCDRLLQLRVRDTSMPYPISFDPEIDELSDLEQLARSDLCALRPNYASPPKGTTTQLLSAG